MPAPRLISTPSGGQSEVLAVLREQGANASRPGILVSRLARLVAERFHGDGNQGADATWISDTLDVLATLNGAGKTSAATLVTHRVKLTVAGQVSSRHPRARPRAVR
jgi:hypothetical protein